jgi:hypothetical protein
MPQCQVDDTPHCKMYEYYQRVVYRMNVFKEEIDVTVSTSTYDSKLEFVPSQTERRWATMRWKIYKTSMDGLRCRMYPYVAVTIINAAIFNLGAMSAMDPAAARAHSTAFV